MHHDWVENNPNMRVSDFLRLDLQTYFDINRGKGPVEFLPGIARIACEELGYFQANRNEGDMSRFKQLVMIIHTDEGIRSKFDRNLNGYSFYELNKEISPVLKSKAEANKQKLKDFKTTNNEYRIIPINSFEEAKHYNKYTSWCVTQDDSHFNTYTQGGNRFYFCLRNGFENASEVTGDTCPLDDYGLSMISVLVDSIGEPVHITTRWNHKYDGEDNPNLKDAEQFQELLGINFYKTFLPYTKDELHKMGVIPLYEVPELLASGVEPEEIFNWVGATFDDCFMVELNNKFNYIYNKKLLSEKWFDSCFGFREGFGIVELKNKYNFIDKNAKFLTTTWFDYADFFNEGFARVNLNNKYNFINQEGKFLSNQWFAESTNFQEGFAKISLNDKSNFINKKGEYLSNQWFDRCLVFHEGLSVVILNNKYNFINKNGDLISNEWFDSCKNFYEGLAVVRLGNIYNYIKEDGEYLSKDGFAFCDNFHEGFGRISVYHKGANYIDREGNLLSDKWFDYCWDFNKGFGIVEIDGNKYKILKNSRLISF